MASVQAYIDQHHLDDILKDLISSLLYHKPSKPIRYLIESLKALEGKEGQQVNYLDLFRQIAQTPVAKEEKKHAETPQSTPEKRRVGFASEPPPSQPQRPAVNALGVTHNPRRRGSVSAESLKPTDEDKTDRVIIPKTDEARRRILSAISNNLLFRNLEGDQRQEVMDAMFERKVPRGETVIKQGDEGDNFYVVDDGIFDIFVNGKKVVEIGAGGSFGELALMYNTPRAATVQAQTDAVVWGVDRVTFRRIIMNNTFRKRKMYENFVKTVPILQSLEPEERTKVADALEPQTFSDGDNIVEEGDPGDCFYIIVSGEVVITKKMKKPKQEGEDSGDESEEEVEVNRLSKGNYFGELALLTDKPRAATVTAVGDVECVCLNTQAFIRLLGPVTEILKRNAETYAKYASAIPNKDQE
jgi:CRP-like cAMP-binding protein